MQSFHSLCRQFGHILNGEAHIHHHQRSPQSLDVYRTEYFIYSFSICRTAVTIRKKNSCRFIRIAIKQQLFSLSVYFPISESATLSTALATIS